MTSKIDPNFKVQLANTYDPDKTYKGIDYWYASYKYDGIRCMYLNKTPDVIYSRKGLVFIGSDDIVSQCNELASRLAISNKNDIFIDGELYSDELDFNSIQSIVMTEDSTVVDKNKIYLRVFAVGPFKDSYEMVSIFSSSIFDGLDKLKPIKYFTVHNDKETITNKCKECIQNGYEGIMLRDPVVPYDWKRSNKLLKYKMFKDSHELDMTIVDILPGKSGTKYSDTMGAVLCIGYINGTEVRCRVGSGFTDQERHDIWDHPEKYLNKEIVVRYQDITSDSKTGNISIRFPIKKCFKLDR